MRMSTEIAVGIRHVGKADEPNVVMAGSAFNCLQRVIEFMKATSMATRIEIVFARTEAEIQNRFNAPVRSASSNAQADELLAMLSEDMKGQF